MTERKSILGPIHDYPLATGEQHADTVRRVLLAANEDVYGDKGNRDAFEAVNALLAENEFLKEQLEAQTQNAEHYLAENQRLRGALERISRFGRGGLDMDENIAHLHGIANEALAALTRDPEEKT
jgi:hypothetical protein